MNNTNSIKHSSTDKNDCAILGMIQIAMGSILLLASFYGFSVLQSNVIILPALMAVALIGNGIHTLLVKCTVFKMSLTA